MTPPKDRAELVEVMAFAFYWKLTSGHGTPTEAAQAALAALEAAGVAQVPVVATDAMMQAGRSRPYNEDDNDADSMDRNTELTWCNMLAASPYAPNPEKLCEQSRTGSPKPENPATAESRNASGPQREVGPHRINAQPEAEAKGVTAPPPEARSDG